MEIQIIDNGFIIKCPVRECGTENFTRWNSQTQSGMCANKHHVMTDDSGNLYCPDSAG